MMMLQCLGGGPTEGRGLQGGETGRGGHHLRTWVHPGGTSTRAPGSVPLLCVVC
jgi:hypothetical protein